MDALVSVILPVYNVEPYLAKCLDSILAQAYSNLEIILVEDGSPDNSGSICDEYAKKDSRIHVIHKENGGVSSARNAGLDLAKGKYVSFIDSDDCVDPAFISTMVQKMESENADIVTLNFCSESAKGCKPKVMHMKDAVSTYTHPDLYRIWESLSTQVSIFIWNNLYKLDILNRYHIRFHAMSEVFSEDQLFNFCYYSVIQKAVNVDQSLYLYQVHSSTLSRKITPPNLLDRWINLMHELQKFLVAHHLPKQSFSAYALLYWDKFFTVGCARYGSHERTLEAIDTISPANRKFYKKMLFQMLIGKAGRKYIRSQKLNPKNALYFRLMILLLCLGKNDRPVRTYLNDNVGHEQGY